MDHLHCFSLFFYFFFFIFLFFFSPAYMSSVLYVVSAIGQYTLHLVGKPIIKSSHQLVAAL